MPAATRRQYVKSAVLLAVTAVSLYLLLPGLISVFSSWRSLEHLDWPFAVLVLLFEVASSFCLWEVDRIALASNGWSSIACAQAGNALGRIVPGSATPFTVVMLQKAGVDGGEAAAALTASTGLQITTALALPVLALPAMIGGAPINRGLETAAYLGVAVAVAMMSRPVSSPLLLRGLSQPRHERRTHERHACWRRRGRSHARVGAHPLLVVIAASGRLESLSTTPRETSRKEMTVALSDRLAELAKRTKEAEDRSRVAASEARDELRSTVEQASESAQKKADELAQRADAAEARASDWWGEIQSDWARHVTAIREDFAAKKAEHEAKRSKVEADLAADDAASAIDFAFAAVEEAEYAVLEATLAQMEADEASSSM
jgi:hypothetical protein